jgi:hypothetical protein
MHFALRFAGTWSPLSSVAGILALLLVLSGCGKEEVRTYRAPKETNAMPAQPDAAAMAAAHGHGLGAVMPQITYQAPPNWAAQDSGGVRIVRFIVQGENEQAADVGVVPLPGANVKTSELLNMIRSQAELAPITEADLPTLGQKVPIGPLQGDLFEMASTNRLIEQKFKARILMATVKHEETLWLFKLAGADDLVREQRPAFLEFLKSVGFDAAPAGAMAQAMPNPHAGIAPAPAAGTPQWDVPTGWQQQPPGQMVIGRFSIGAQEAKAEVTVSAFPGDTGGLVANVNRWRGQVGLDAVDAAEAEKQTESLDSPAGKATLVDVTGTDRKTGQPARLIGVIVPRGGKTWFFKMLGQPELVGREKAALLKFMQSTKYPNA